VDVLVGADKRPIKIPSSEIPFLPLPEMIEAVGLLEGRSTQSPVAHTISLYTIRGKCEETARQYGGITLNYVVEYASYFRMLAKITHGVVVSHYGLSDIDYVLPPFILGKDPYSASSVIGKDPQQDMPITSVDVHQADVLFNPSIISTIAVRMRLFAALGTTSHVIIVATTKLTAEQLKEREPQSGNKGRKPGRPSRRPGA
jgi:hypothetical protein